MEEGYPILYVLDGGTNSVNNPATYIQQDKDLELFEATKEGFTFAGWFKDSRFRQPVSHIPAGHSGELTLYAKWVPLEKDKDGKLTSIAVELVDGYSYTYTEKAIRPTVKVHDNHRLLTRGTNYKVSYKYNTNTFSISDNHTAARLKKAPQVIVTGVGSYKSSQTIIHRFNIEQQDLAEVVAVYKDSMEVKANDKLQKASVSLTYQEKKVPAKAYKISCFKDYNSIKGELTGEQRGITSAGVYYLLVEAAKDPSGKYTGNFRGQQILTVRAVSKGEALSMAKISYSKSVTGTGETLTDSQVLQKVIKSLKIGGKTYQTAGEGLESFLQTFEVESKTVSENGILVPTKQLLETAGKKTILIRGKEGASSNYAGTRTVSFIVKGNRLSKKMLNLSYETNTGKTTTSAVYTGNVQLPKITTKNGYTLKKGKDYRITYLLKKNPVEESRIINVGFY